MWVKGLKKKWRIFLYGIGDRVMLEDGDALPWSSVALLYFRLEGTNEIKSRILP